MRIEAGSPAGAREGAGVMRMLTDVLDEYRRESEALRLQREQADEKYRKLLDLAAMWERRALKAEAEATTAEATVRTLTEERQRTLRKLAVALQPDSLSVKHDDLMDAAAQVAQIAISAVDTSNSYKLLWESSQAEVAALTARLAAKEM